MKFFITIFFVAILLATSSKAQKSNAPSVQYGVKTGVNFSDIKFSDNGTSETASGTGFLAGFYAALPIGSTFKIQPELFYNNINGKSDDVTLNLNYLSLSVLAKHGFNNTGFSILAGPQIGFLLSAKETYKGVTTDYTSEAKSNDFSLVVGAEYSFPSGINFSARYNAGLANVAKNTDPTDNFTVKLSAFTIALGYSFGKK